MSFYPYDYPVMRADVERRARAMQQAEAYGADWAYTMHVIGRAIGWIGVWMEKIGERMTIPSRETSLSQE